MSTVVTCLPCREGQHIRCAIGYTRKGVLGGWVCGCPDPVCVGERKKKSGHKATNERDENERG